jgi:NAD(P)H-nitrite reductase large subunit
MFFLCVKDGIIKSDINVVKEDMMEQNINSEILDKLTKVCVCRVVSRASIKKTISDGSKSVEDVERVTGAGSGSCKGKRCTGKIQKLLDEFGDG